MFIDDCYVIRENQILFFLKRFSLKKTNEQGIKFEKEEVNNIVGDCHSYAICNTSN